MNSQPESDSLPKTFPYPLYQQLISSCGLASLLMLLDPEAERNSDLQTFLALIHEEIRPLITKITPDFDLGLEFNYQYVFQYLLLKAESQEAPSFQFLYEFLADKFGYSYADQCAVRNFQLLSKHDFYLENGLMDLVKAYDRFLLERSIVTPALLKDETSTIKSGFNLKILMTILGWEFVAHESGDGTGALYLSKKTKEPFILALIEGHLDENVRILFNDHNHWMAVVGLYPKNLRKWQKTEDFWTSKRSINEFTLVVNNPIGPKQELIELKNLKQSQRFYFFKAQDHLPTALWEKILEAIARDSQEES
jgi:hypothetical protein